MIGVTVVTVIRNLSPDLEIVLNRMSEVLTGLNRKTNLILVDTGSDDNTMDEAERLLRMFPDIHYYGLSGTAHKDYAYLAGMEHATPGDIVVLFNPMLDDACLIPEMIAMVESGHDLVVASRRFSRSGGWSYWLLSNIFVRVFRIFGHGDIRSSASRFRALSSRAVSHITKYDATAIGYGVIPFISRFRRGNITQNGKGLVENREEVSVIAGIKRAMTLVSNSSRAPLRLTSALCIAAAMLSLMSSGYVAVTYLLHNGVAPGWTTLSLQMNGMFFLLSLALATMAEYILTLKSSSHPPYHIVSSFDSSTMTRKATLNIAEENRN